ncbi:hypothetical protein [Clostridium manihotivorum]|nr:hypothetical protein [Clostridium manihotivorum]
MKKTKFKKEQLNSKSKVASKFVVDFEAALFIVKKYKFLYLNIIR